jgi:hypothetical protein
VKFYAKEILDDVNKWDSEDEKRRLFTAAGRLVLEWADS